MEVKYISVSTDGGAYWKSGVDGALVYVRLGGEEGNLELLFKFTDEGLVIDVFADDDSKPTVAESYSNIIERLA